MTASYTRIKINNFSIYQLSLNSNIRNNSGQECFTEGKIIVMESILKAKIKDLFVLAISELRQIVKMSK